MPAPIPLLRRSPAEAETPAKAPSELAFVNFVIFYIKNQIYLEIPGISPILKKFPVIFVLPIKSIILSRESPELKLSRILIFPK